MPRANRYYQEGYAYHITHRCNHKEFLLAYKKDKQCYRYWLFQAVKRYGLSVLNYTITNNHIHLLVLDTGDEVIQNSMCYIASRVSFLYNHRKKIDNGAFWQGRYYATAVQDGEYLLSCMLYIDLNMVRCGVVKHPSEWQYGGYYEWLSPRKRYRIINEVAALQVLGFAKREHFLQMYNQLVAEKIEKKLVNRDPKWTEQPAVGDEKFIKQHARLVGSFRS